jgi:hypothetical protein
MEAAHDDNAIHVEHFTAKVALEENKIGSTDPNIPKRNNCIDDHLYFRMPQGCEDYYDKVDEIDQSISITISSRQQRAAIELVRFDLGTCDVDREEAEHSDDVDADEMDEASQADNGITQHLED